MRRRCGREGGPLPLHRLRGEGSAARGAGMPSSVPLRAILPGVRGSAPTGLSLGHRGRAGGGLERGMILLWTLLALLVLLGLVCGALLRERLRGLELSLVVVRQRRELGRLRAVLEAVGPYVRGDL